MVQCKYCKADLSNPRNNYCSNRCRIDLEYQQNIEKWFSGILTGLRGINTFAISGYVKRYLREKHNDSCQRCGWNEKHPDTGEVPLEVHHIDGNFFNTVENNIELLCPNCHSLTSTYRARNKGMGRARQKATT